MLDDKGSSVMHLSNVLAIARTQSKVEDFKQLIVPTVPDNFKVDTNCYCHWLGANDNSVHYRAIIIEIDTPSASPKTLDVIRKARASNPASTIFLIISFATSLSKTKYYLAGADYCIKVAETSSEKKLSVFSDFFSDQPWLPHPDLVLDQDHMCLYGAGRKLEISFVEMKVLEALIDSRILSHDEIASVMGFNTKFYDSRALEKAISRLRSKIKNRYGDNIIQNIRGYGYKLSRGLTSHGQPPSR
jgi:DNA-binding response OmpR family regulator